MILCFDVGNSDIYGGVFEGDRLVFEFRKSSRIQPSVDEFGLFLLQLLAVHKIEVTAIARVAMASVVPECEEVITRACAKFLDRPVLNLKAGIKTGLKIRVRTPNEVGADRIATAIAAVNAYPGKDLIVVDMGTATTFCAINRDREYLGGVIAAGMGLSMRALAQNTAKLPFVEILRRREALGRDTVENIQSGLYFGHIGLLREVTARLTTEAFAGRRPLLIGTGGFSRIFAEEGVFDVIVPDLVLVGLRRAIELNP